MIIIAGIKTSINLIDNMSKVLNRITGNAIKMNDGVARAQETMNKRTQFAENLSRDERKLINLTDQLEYQQRTVRRLSKEFQKSLDTMGRNADTTLKLEKQLLSAESTEIRFAEAVDRASKKLEEQDNKMRNSVDTSGNLINKVKSLVGAYLSFRAAKKLITDTIGGAGELNQRVAVMQAAFGNQDIGRHYFNRLQLYAIDTRNDIEDLTEVTRNFMQLTKNTNKLMGLTDVANRLSMRTGNIGSAEGMMQEAMRGEYSRLQRSLHLTDSQIEPLKKAVKRGSLDGMIGAFDEALNTAGLTDEIVKAYQDNPMQKFYKAIDRGKLKLAKAGEEALMRLEPTFDKINTWLQSANADQFFGAIAAGVSIIVNGIIWLTETVANNWDIIRAILVSIAVVYLAYIIVQLKTIIPKLWSTIPPILAQGAAWMATHWPIMIVIAAILIFIGILKRAGVTADQVTGFVGGVFGALWANIYNGIAYVWNIFASFAEFFVNLFIDPKYAVEKLFYDLAMNVLGFFNNLFKGIVDGLNWVIEKMDKYLGTDIGTVQLKFMDNAMSKLEKYKPKSDKDVWEAVRMEYKDYATEIKKGYDFGASLPGKFSQGLYSIESAINNFGSQEDLWNASQRDTLGSIDDNTKSLKKTEEDLKWMRDLAEQEVVNRFTTATLAPQISVAFGDVRETADVDGIVAHIENILTEQINIAAEGVHN
ncbi:hypothetical protein RBU61_14080 [Tissierella sp. MB52-C2]|uniref:hypothetical protein n=1 Tax=Tissierella sp. MB52-C2 TaxID=3070999 RepID=UPI00280A52CD|nr:hypothetical protein [Tissierella sp. MB52-C2]WMM24043.1 hypothetical protein RBU61_14080 [Tissierella sp. MB52-C2]